MTDEEPPFSPYYYRQWFPVNYLCYMLGANSLQGDTRYGYRDLSFGNAPKDSTMHSDTIWCRRSLFHRDEFREAMRDSMLRRIDIGQLGYEPCQMWRSWEFRTFDHGMDARLWRMTELVIDIDIKNEYKDLRTCGCSETEEPRRCGTCRGVLQATGVPDERVCVCPWRKFDGDLCKSCWSFGSTAILVLDQILRHKWSFRDVIFTFSGKKGIHCWVLDAETRSWTDKQRTDFFESLNPWAPKPATYKLKWENTADDVYFGADFEGSVLPLFEMLMLDTEIFDFAHQNTRLAIVNCFNPAQESAEFQTAFGEMLGAVAACVVNNANARHVWHLLMDFNYRYSPRQHADIVRRRLVYTYVFPRIDKGSTPMGHLTKLPFAAHEKTHILDVPLLPLTSRFSPPDAPRACDDDMIKIDEVLTKFQLEIDIIRSRVYQFLYCKAVFPNPMPYRRLMTLADNKARFLQCRTFLTPLVSTQTVFNRERDYQAHCAQCKRCNGHILEDRQNTLRLYIQASCCDEDTLEIDTELEGVLKLAWIEHLAPMFTNIATKNLLTEIKQLFA